MQSDLISRKNLLEILEKKRAWALKHGEVAFASSIWDDMNTIKRVDAIDAVEVVRCRDCRYYSGCKDKPGEVTAIGYCDHPNHHILPMTADRYCADARKKDGGEKADVHHG